MSRIASLLLLLALSIAPVLCLTAEPQPTTNDDVAAQLKSALDERVKVLSQLVELLTGYYKLGAVDIAQVATAENDFCNALLDSTDEPEKRIALLTKQLDKVSDILKITQGRRQTGQVDVAVLYRAKSLYLDVTIKLLRERGKDRPPTPNATGK